MEQGWLNRFGDQLTPDEAVLLRRAAAQPRYSDALLNWWNRQTARDTAADPNPHVADSAAPTHPLIHLADAYRSTIIQLISGATNDVDLDDNDDLDLDDDDGEEEPTAKIITNAEVLPLKTRD